MTGGIRLVLCDVDGTLLTNDKRLTGRAIAAVGSLRRAGIEFALTSGRPPRGMSMLIEPLALATPLAAFNGGVLARPDLSIISQKSVPGKIVPSLVTLMRSNHLDVWLYSGSNWYVLDENAPHVDRESRTVEFRPTTVESFGQISAPIAKIVGVSDQHDDVEAADRAVRQEFGTEVSAARSQPYYLDVTHPEANKGFVITYLSYHLDIPLEAIATIGDMPNDVLMFKESGLSIAMGNAAHDVQREANEVTTSNDHEGFARAIESFVLSR